MEITSDGNYTLRPSELYPEVYMIRSLYPDGEYLLLEVRRPLLFDSYIWQPGGLLIYHVDENAKGPGNQIRGFPGQSGWPGNGKHYTVALMQRDGLYDLEKAIDNGGLGDFWIAGQNLTFGPGNGESVAKSATYPNTDSYAFGTIKETGLKISAFEDRAGGAASFQVTGMPIAGGLNSPSTSVPTKAPVPAPSPIPTKATVPAPSSKPTRAPTRSPVTAPTKTPTQEQPTMAPATEPTPAPTRKPTGSPTRAPVNPPTRKPTGAPTQVPLPAPTTSPTKVPVPSPTNRPTPEPAKANVSATTQGPAPTGVVPNPGQGKALAPAVLVDPFLPSQKVANTGTADNSNNSPVAPGTPVPVTSDHPNSPNGPSSSSSRIESTSFFARWFFVVSVLSTLLLLW